MIRFYNPHKSIQRRWLSLYEYQAARLMKEHGIPIANGVVSKTPDEVEMAFRQNSILLCITLEK